jgi:hypothetical protein
MADTLNTTPESFPTLPTPSSTESPSTGGDVEGTTTTTTTSVSSSSNSLLSGLQAVASNMNKGIRAIGTGIDANLKDATANFVTVNNSLLLSVGGSSGGSTTNVSLLGSLGGNLINNNTSTVPMITADRTQPQTNELIYRTRDLRRSTEIVSQQFLTREVDISTNSIQSYTKTMKEIHNSKHVLRPLHDSIGSLASSVGNARIVAAKLVNKV